MAAAERLIEHPLHPRPPPRRHKVWHVIQLTTGVVAVGATADKAWQVIKLTIGAVDVGDTVDKAWHVIKLTVGAFSVVGKAWHIVGVQEERQLTGEILRTARPEGHKMGEVVHRRVRVAREEVARRLRRAVGREIALRKESI